MNINAIIVKINTTNDEIPVVLEKGCPNDPLEGLRSSSKMYKINCFINHNYIKVSTCPSTTF